MCSTSDWIVDVKSVHRFPFLHDRLMCLNRVYNKLRCQTHNDIIPTYIYHSNSTSNLPITPMLINLLTPKLKQINTSQNKAMKLVLPCSQTSPKHITS